MGKDFEKFVKDLDPDPVTSGRKIRSIRKYLGLTLKELEEITGLSEPKLSAMENNHTKISRKSAELLGAALGLHPTDILYPNGIYAKDEDLLEVERKAQIILHSKAVAK